MSGSENKTSFDKLVAGLSSEDRHAMLKRINQNAAQTSHLSSANRDVNEKYVSLKLKLKEESFFYKVILWLRSIFQKHSIEELYSDDMLAIVARKVNHNHPGLVNHKIKSLDYIFYERLQNLKDASDFFKPYFSFIDDNPGDFYVFLSSFVAPELSEKINSEADPFTIPFTKEGTPELRTELSKKLDEILKNMDHGTKANIYSAVSSVNWLKNFVNLPYLHFLAQFTNVAGDVYSCSYKHGVQDYNRLAAVFSRTMPVPNEALEAIFLFSQRKSMTNNAQEKDIERAVKEFLNQAAGFFVSIQSFINGVPIVKIGRLVNENYDWQPENIEGAEAWFPAFRTQWRKILDIRWNDWLREQKKQTLSDNLKSDFNLSDFPMMRTRPWAKLWSRVPFSCELTGGFLSWFAEEKWDEILPVLNMVAMEGIFYRSENRTEFSEGLNNVSSAMTMLMELIGKLESNGEFGKVFENFSDNTVHTLQVQKQIDSMMETIESTVKESIKLFGKGVRTMERVFHGFFDETKDGVHESLQNLNQLGGRENRQFREELKDSRELLNRSIFYISELEPIDSAAK
ncbi:MAG: DUF5312 domain-containing protein [Treponema sp.]|nr:DUF5312 domain-containing protein [Treponema sp.]